MLLSLLIQLSIQLSFAAPKPCDFEPTLMSWLDTIGLPSTINHCELLVDDYNYLEKFKLNLRGKHILDRRADYEAWLETNETGEIGLRFTFYYFKKSAVDTEAKAREIEQEIQSFAKSSGLEISKTETKAEEISAKNLEWKGLLQFRLKPSKKTPDTRYKLKEIDIGLKFRLNRLEFYAILKSPNNHPAFGVAKMYANGAVQMLSKEDFPDFSAPSFVKPQSNDKPLTFDSSQGLPDMIKRVHQRLEAI